MTVCRSLVAILIPVSCIEAQTLRKIESFDLPGPEGERFDYPALDDEDHWLLSAHLGPGILYVIDVPTNELVKAIPGVPGITGWKMCRVSARFTRPIGEKKQSASSIGKA